MKRLLSKKGLAVVLAGAIVLGGAGAALAYFTSTGGGTGSASVGTAGSWTVTQVGAASPASTLAPDAAPGGANIETVTYKVTNNGSGTQNLASVTVAVDPTFSFVDANSDPACNAADFSLNGGTPGASATSSSLAGEVMAGATTANSTFTIELIDNGHNQDSCKNQTVPLVFTAS